MSGKKLVTGAAGFIGFHLSKRLLDEGESVVGIDSINEYYDPNLKQDRLDILKKYSSFEFHQVSIDDQSSLMILFEKQKFEHVVHLAAQAGVRYSITNPDVYISSNIIGFHNVLEAVRQYPVKHLLYASSSSVYGGNDKLPFSISDQVDHPVSLYAATKKSNELMAHTYSHLFNIPTTGLRFFTVYGPWGRPDMALYKFAELIFQDKPIDVYNNGEMKRDFTYIDDIIESILRLIPKVPTLESSHSKLGPYKLFNIGSNNPVNLIDYIKTLEAKIGKKAKKNMLPMQPGEVKETFADVDELVKEIDFSPDTSIEMGIAKFVEWFKGYKGYT